MWTHSMLLQVLKEAEARRDDEALPIDVRERSAETANLCLQRMNREGLTRARLEDDAQAEA